MLTLACDYRVMIDGTARRAWACMNEVTFGAPWPASFAALLRAKLPDGAVHRAVALEGRRFTPQDARAVGLVDALAGPGTDAVLAAACERAAQVAHGARGGAWGLIKVRSGCPCTHAKALMVSQRDLYRDVLERCASELRTVLPALEDGAAGLKARL
jgi:enoyl-CoA hydratase/carnithine racemase